MSEEVENMPEDNEEMHTEAGFRLRQAPVGVEQRHPKLHPNLQNLIPHVPKSSIPEGHSQRQHELASLPGEHGQRASRLLGNGAQPNHVLDHVTNILNNNVKHASLNLVAEPAPAPLHPDVNTIINDKPHKGHVKNPETDGRLHDNKKKKRLKRNFEVEQYLQKRKELDYLRQQQLTRRKNIGNLLVHPLYGELVKNTVGSQEFVSFEKIANLYDTLKSELNNVKEIHAKNELHKVISIIASYLFESK